MQLYIQICSVCAHDVYVQPQIIDRNFSLFSETSALLTRSSIGKLGFSSIQLILCIFVNIFKRIQTIENDCAYRMIWHGALHSLWHTRSMRMGYTQYDNAMCETVSIGPLSFTLYLRCVDLLHTQVHQSKHQLLSLFSTTAIF